MTLVIGLLTEVHPSDNPSVPNSGTLLLAADTMATYQAPTPFIYPSTTTVATAPYHGKIYPLPHGFYCAFCDDYAWSHQIATELYGRMARLDQANPGFRDLIKQEIQNSFDYAFLWLRPEALRNEVGITVSEYLSADLDATLREQARQALQEASRNMPAELIVAGQTPRGPFLLKANATAIMETTEYHVSGGPVESAINWFRYRRQQNSFAVQRSFFHMLEAKKFCEIDPSVGRETQFVMIPPVGNPQIMRERGRLAENWMAEFGVRPTDSLESPDRRRSFETAFDISLN